MIISFYEDADGTDVHEIPPGYTAGAFCGFQTFRLEYTVAFIYVGY